MAFRSFPAASRVLVSIAASLALLGGCDSNTETGCESGTCDPPPTDDVCDATCDVDETHGLPCDVYKILSNVCQDCHVAGGIGPFTLVSYADTQCTYGKTGDPPRDAFVWEKMQRAVQKDATPPKMPQGAFPLPDACLDTLNAWFETCASGECAHGEGNNEGAGGAEVGFCEVP